ncbi:phage tail protein [Salmonella enterica]|uniref:phage tail protein n=1 Tax=Salmonella enterica TaxID=28901 RepID=UPI003D31C270
MLQRLGSKLVSSKVSHYGVSRVLSDKLDEIVTPLDINNANSLVQAMAASGNKFSVFNSTDTFKITVGDGGDYANLYEAIEGACKMRPTYKEGKSYCEISLKRGFILREQLEFTGGFDLSWIKITSEDEVVYADTSAFTKKVRHYYEYKYLFLFTEGTKSPIFSILIQENRDDSDVCAFMITRFAELNFWPGSGARKFYVGVDSHFGCWIKGYHTGSAPDKTAVDNYQPPGYFLCDFSDSRYNAIMADSSYVHLPCSKFDRSGNSFNRPSVTCIYNTVAHFQGSSAKDCYIGWNVRDGAHVNMRDHQTTNCTYRGLTCIHGVFVDARRHDVEETDIPTSGKVLNPEEQNGFYGCLTGVRVDGAAIVDLAGNDMRNCGTTINCDNGAVVSAKGLDVSGAKTTVFQCQGGSTVACPRLWADNIKQLCVLRYDSKVTSRWATIATQTKFEQLSRFCDADMSGHLTLSDSKVDGDIAFFAGNSSTISISGSSTVKVRAFRSFTGSKVTLSGITYNPEYAKAVSPEEQQFRVSQGGIIAMNPITISDGSVPILSKPRNTLSDAGIIFSAIGNI